MSINFLICALEGSRAWALELRVDRQGGWDQGGNEEARHEFQVHVGGSCSTLLGTKGMLVGRVGKALWCRAVVSRGRFLGILWILRNRAIPSRGITQQIHCLSIGSAYCCMNQSVRCARRVRAVKGLVREKWPEETVGPKYKWSLWSIKGDIWLWALLGLAYLTHASKSII